MCLCRQRKSKEVTFKEVRAEADDAKSQTEKVTVKVCSIM